MKLRKDKSPTEGDFRRSKKREAISAEAATERIIDMHAHIAGTGAGGSGCHISPKLRRNWRFKVYLRAFGLRREELAEEGDALSLRRISEEVTRSRHVDGAVILALDGVVDDTGELDLGGTELYVPNEFVATESARYDNLHYGASVNPRRKDALDRLEEAATKGAVLLKWLPSIQKIDPADKALTPFYLKLAELGLPLLVHTGAERSFTRSENDLGDPQRLKLPLGLGVTVIAAHLATTGSSEGESHFERLLKMFPRHPNLYGDISTLTQLNKLPYLSRAIHRSEIHDRLLYGTDYPLIETALVSPWYLLPRIGWRQARDLAGLENCWDRDLQLKLALGFPRKIFTRPAQLLNIGGAPREEPPAPQK